MKNLREFNLSCYSLDVNGNIFSSKSNRFLKGWVSDVGYRMVALTNDSGEILQNVSLHRLMAKAFLGDFPDLQVNHKNGNKLDNSLTNLEWVTPSENTRHSNVNGLRKKSYFEDCNILPDNTSVIHDWNKSGKPYDHWTEEEAHNVCRYLQDGMRVCDISSITGLCRRSIQFIRDGERKWGHIAKEYDFSKISRKEKTSIEKVVDICKMLEQGHSINSVSKILCIDRKIVSGIKNRKTHKIISEPFKF